MKENIDFFLEAAAVRLLRSFKQSNISYINQNLQELGVKRQKLFMTKDLVEGNNDSNNQV